jgi:hypothetical protein
MCKPGTQICLLILPTMPFRSIWSQALRDLGIEGPVLAGGLGRSNNAYADQSDYRVGPDLLDSFLTEILRNVRQA